MLSRLLRNLPFGALLPTLLLVGLCAALSNTAFAEPRVALVIGNDAYGTLPDLNNARADARGMAAKLESLGFEVILKLDAGRRDFGRALADFEGRLASAEVGLVFYAGHGIQADGRNWLIPSDAEIEIEEDLRFEGIDSGEILQTMKRAGSDLNIVILDACRDNPLPKRSRSAARGLVVASVPKGIKGTAIVYSAAPGETAQDGDPGGNGVFTGALLAVLDEPGLSLEQVFKKTAARVARRTGGKQKPWINSSVTGDFYFKPRVQAASPAPTTGGVDKETLFWQSIQSSDDPAMFEAYLEQFPNGTFAPLARAKVAALKTEQVAGLTPPTVEDMDATFVAVKTANVRAGPSAETEKMGRLTIDDPVAVTGKVRGKDWYRIAHAGATAYVFVPLIAAVDPAELVAWRRVKGSNQASDVEAFLEAHPTGPFAVQAETLLAALTPVPGTAPSAGPKATPGDRARGLALLERAVDTAESIGDPKIRVYATGYLIDELFRQGRPAAVRRLATSVQNAFAAIGENREYYVGILAQVLVVAGNEGEALGLADQYSDQRDSILQSISEGLAVRGDFEAALRKSDQIGDIEYRGWALRDIARQVMKGGDTQRALRIVNRMSDADDRAMELTVISDAQRKAGDMTGAGRTLAMAEDALRAAAASDRSSVLNALVEGYSALGDRSAAERILGDLRALPSRLAEDIEREFAQNRLASAEALLGDFNGARLSMAEQKGTTSAV